MRSLALAAVVLVLVVAPACNLGTLADLSEDKAPTGSDAVTDQALAIWRVYDPAKGPDSAVKTALANIDAVVAQAGLPTAVRIGSITKDDLALVGKGDNDPGPAQGMLLIDEISCSLTQIDPYIVAKNQDALYPDTYQNYKRTFTSSVQDYLSGASPVVTWATSYDASLGENAWTATLTGGARHVPGALPNGGPVILARTVLDAPAKFTMGGENSGFDQDYQIELYYERTPGRVLHFYALWRDFHISGLGSTSDLYVNTVLGALSDFDIRTGILCQKQPVAPKYE